MKFLLTVLVLASTVAFATETKQVKTTTTESHAADHSHVNDAAKADHAHDDAHHTEKKVETKTHSKKSH